MAKNPEPLFFIARDEGQVAGPYDVVQMAGLLRRKIITGETMTRLDGTEDWKPFSWQPQFALVRELPADAVSTRVAELDEAAAETKSGQFPCLHRRRSCGSVHWSRVRSSRASLPSLWPGLIRRRASA